MPLKLPLRRRKKPPTLRWWMGRRLTAYGKQAVSVLVLVGTLFLRDQQAAAPVAKREEEDAPYMVWTVDLNTGGPSMSGGRSYPMPLQPHPDQKRPPCLPRTEREANGGCWTPHAETPPCPYGTVEHAGACFQPVARPQRSPTSVGD